MTFLAAQARIQQHVPSFFIDLLMRSQKALAEIAGSFGGLDGGSTPRLDVEGLSVQIR